MDPGTAIGAGITTLDSLNKIGGAVAVLLGLLVLLAAVAIVLSVKAFRHLTVRLGQVEDDRVRLLGGCITENTTVLREVKTEVIRQTATISQQTDAMRSRPCLIETGVHSRTPLPATRC